ncbi:MAG: energy transducer TonB [Opitutales bacterium]
MPVRRPGRVGFEPRRSKVPLLRIVLLTLLIVLGLLAILPITQWLSGDFNRRTVRSVEVATLAPPEPPPPEPPPPPEEEQEEPEPELEDTPPPVDISQLEAALNPGMGGALGRMADIGNWGVMPDAAAELDIFSIADLDSRPRRIRTVMPEYPTELQSQGVTGIVRLEVLIDEEGNVTVEDVIDGPHPTLIQNARQAVSRWRFEPPTKDGRPVRARYIQPIPFEI